ncbi:MAG: hypothetical protein ACJ8EL_03380 [Rhizomicrobium sp.]
MSGSGDVALLREKEADYRLREKDALALATSAFTAEHRTAMEQVANTWRLLAEIMAREIADAK